MVGQHLRQRVTQYPRLLPMSERKNVKLSHAHMFADPLRHLRMRPRGRSEPMALQTGIAEAWSLLRYCNDGSLHCRKAPLFPVGCYVTLRAGRTLCRAPLPAGGIETCRACPWWHGARDTFIALKAVPAPVPTLQALEAPLSRRLGWLRQTRKAAQDRSRALEPLL